MSNIYDTSKVLIRVESLYIMPTSRGKFKIVMNFNIKYSVYTDTSETYNTVIKQAVILLDFQVFWKFSYMRFL